MPLTPDHALYLVKSGKKLEPSARLQIQGKLLHHKTEKERLLISYLYHDSLVEKLETVLLIDEKLKK